MILANGDNPVSAIELDFLLKLAHGPSLPPELNDLMIDTLTAVLRDMAKRAAGAEAAKTEPSARRNRQAAISTAT